MSVRLVHCVTFNPWHLTSFVHLFVHRVSLIVSCPMLAIRHNPHKPMATTPPHCLTLTLSHIFSRTGCLTLSSSVNVSTHRLVLSRTYKLTHAISLHVVRQDNAPFNAPMLSQAWFNAPSNAQVTPIAAAPTVHELLLCTHYCPN